MDAFVDDNVTMAKRLKALGKDVGIDVLPGLSHGFLNFVQVINFISFHFIFSDSMNFFNHKMHFKNYIWFGLVWFLKII